MLYLAEGNKTDAGSVTTTWDDAYNLTVNGTHTYHITIGDTEALVHNCGDGLVPSPNGAMRDPTTGRFAPNPDKAPTAPSSNVHGNSQHSEQPTTLNQLYLDDGTSLKTRITANPLGRYPAAYMSDKSMIQINIGSRSNMMDLERMIVEIDPGPLNLERWAGIGR